MTVREAILHDHALITAQTQIRVVGHGSEARGSMTPLAEGTKYSDAVLAYGERLVEMLNWVQWPNGGAVTIWLAAQS